MLDLRFSLDHTSKKREFTANLRTELDPGVDPRSDILISYNIWHRHSIRQIGIHEITK